MNWWSDFMSYPLYKTPNRRDRVRRLLMWMGVWFVCILFIYLLHT